MLKASSDIYKTIPTCYIFTERDNAVPVIPQGVYSSGVASEDNIIRLDSDHVPFVSHPKELEQAIRKAITKTGAKRFGKITSGC